MKSLTKNLFKTFIISTVLAIAANCIYYAIIQQGKTADYAHVVSQIAGGTLMLTVILLIMSLPVLFLLNVTYWNNKLMRVLLYFSGPVVFVLAALNMQVNRADKVFDLITGFSFLIVHSVFYYLTTKNTN
jgi:hypothetical protein